MAQSVKLADDIMALVRREAELQSRSVAGQIAHWLKIGRAIEHSSAFDYGRVKLVLEARLDTAELKEGEEAVNDRGIGTPYFRAKGTPVLG